MTIFGSHVGPHIPNIGYLDSYEGIWRYMVVYGEYVGICKYMRVRAGIGGLRPGGRNGAG